MAHPRHALNVDNFRVVVYGRGQPEGEVVAVYGYISEMAFVFTNGRVADGFKLFHFIQSSNYLYNRR